MKRSVIITAGGIGKRMGTDIPKQFLLLHNKPIIFHTINCFLKFDHQIELIITLPESHIPEWENYCQKYFFTYNHKVVIGGTERFNSIKNALQEVTGNVVAIHDGVRPFVSQTVIKNCFDALDKFDAVIPVVNVNESLRKIDATGSTAVLRSDYKLVQTPQCFQADQIKKAYEQNYQVNFTDDASVFESAGGKVHLVEGNQENIKITQPIDLEIASVIGSNFT